MQTITVSDWSDLFTPHDKVTYYNGAPFTGIADCNKASTTSWQRKTYLDGRLHSFDDEPALLFDAFYYEAIWYKNGLTHREDGPAHVHNFGGDFEYRFYLDDESYRLDHWLDRLTCDFEDKVMMKLRWA